MISETRMWYGSSVLRHGRSRPFLRYQASRFRRKRCLRAGVGSERVRVANAYNPTEAWRDRSRITAASLGLMLSCPASGRAVALTEHKRDTFDDSRPSRL